MRGFEPFETKPHLAVAVSGGADSMALALLAAPWAARRGGSITALSVDHGLRPEAGVEVRRVKRWLAARGIAQRILVWREAKPRANLQAEAREARYRLIEEWCRTSGVLHLLVAHQSEDQAETFLLRLARGSALEGLAAMAPLSERAGLRLLRPLLGLPRARLIATLRTMKQEWIEDPSNEDTRHARVRLRALMPRLFEEGLEAARLAATAHRLARARAALEGETARLLAAAVELEPSGYALLEPALLAAAPEEIGLRALARLIQTLGGASHSPRLERLTRLYRAILGSGLPAPRTLGGCRVLPAPGRSRAGRLLICREWRNCEPARTLKAGETLLWDGRFRLSLVGRLPRLSGPLKLAALGEEGWAQLAALRPDLRASAIPPAVRPSLPALRDLDGLLAVPHLHYGRGPEQAVSLYFRNLIFHPARALAGAGGMAGREKVA